MLATDLLSKALVTLTGDLDVATRASTEAALLAADADVVTVDLRGVRFIDGGALGLLVALKKRLRARGRIGIVRIVTANPQFQRLFVVTGLAKVFEIRDSIPEGQAA